MNAFHIWLRTLAEVSEVWVITALDTIPNPQLVVHPAVTKPYAKITYTSIASIIALKEMRRAYPEGTSTPNLTLNHYEFTLEDPTVFKRILFGPKRVCELVEEMKRDELFQEIPGSP